jgi:Amidases related to nicotinamidase
VILEPYQKNNERLCSTETRANHSLVPCALQNGSLAVAEGRTITPVINELLSLPSFVAKVTTQDWHPQNHVSFASNHPPPNNRPFIDTVTIYHPDDPSLGHYETRLWPDHCVQNTPGAELIPELDASKATHNIKKGTDPRVEMYSAFVDPLGVCDSGLNSLLQDEKVSHVYVVGLAGDYCVKSTAMDAVKLLGLEGKVFVIEDGTKPVDGGEPWEESKKDMESKGVKVIGISAKEVRWLYGEGLEA